MFELMFLEHPFRGRSIAETTANIIAGKVSSPTTLKSTSYSTALHACLAGMLAQSPGERLSAQQLLSMPPFDCGPQDTAEDLAEMQKLRSRIVEKPAVPSTHR